jgi:hypothetical protein
VRFSISDLARPPRLSPPQADDPPAMQGTSGLVAGMEFRLTGTIEVGVIGLRKIRIGSFHILTFQIKANPDLKKALAKN